MTKRRVLIICIISILFTLAGCTVYDMASSYVKASVISDIKVGMTKQQVREIAGPPSTSATLIHAQGTCDTYAVAARDGRAQTYFVSFNETDHVMNKGYQSCSDYDSQPK